MSGGVRLWRRVTSSMQFSETVKEQNSARAMERGGVRLRLFLMLCSIVQKGVLRDQSAAGYSSHKFSSPVTRGDRHALICLDTTFFVFAIFSMIPV